MPVFFGAFSVLYFENSEIKQRGNMNRGGGAKIPVWAMLLAGAALILWCVYPFILSKMLPLALRDQTFHYGTQLGQIGDLYGSLNCLFTIIGFFGIAYSLYLQRAQFEASLADMKENALASEHQAIALEKQTNAAREQSRTIRAQTAVQGRQLRLAQLNAQLHVQIELLKIWSAKPRPSAQGLAHNHDQEGAQIRGSIARIGAQIDGMDFSVTDLG